MNYTQKATIVIALFLVSLCALFPPRRYTGPTISVNHSTVPPRSFLWHQRLHRIGPDGNSMGVEIDTAKLLAEVIVFAAAAGIAFMYVRR